MLRLEKHVIVHQLKEEGFSISAISRKCEISRNTVYSYLEKEFEEAVNWVSELKTRKRKLDPYREYILNWLKEHPDLSASQIADWLEERCSFKDVGESTVRTYVRELREQYHIPKTTQYRVYEAVEELPKGKQIQVDFGEITVQTTQGGKAKLYVIAFVLSHSRYKYAEWQDRPFTTRDVLRCHENAFEFYGGRSDEIVYDQDKLMSVSENGGDVIYTEAFQSYKQQRGFNVYLCRAADPESKGKIENVVKFIKRNFAKNRLFHQIDTWNEQCIAWLERKGNFQVHNTIKKRPVAVFAVEKPHLREVSSILSFESNLAPSITRIVHKDNIIKYHSNRYSVPLGTYNPNEDNTVFLRLENDQLIIEKSPQGETLAVHQLSHGKGQLIKNRNHSRDRSKGIKEYMETVQKSFHSTKEIKLFLDELQKQYPRYIRDQLQIIQRVARDYPASSKSALKVCIQKKLWSANALEDVAKHLEMIENTHTLNEIEISTFERQSSSYYEKAALRELDSYIKMLGGV
ncbi:MAG TPA: IS21 family transposase [Erysipelothrix sp.]|nr:IS21 family transposase [Erysipelothrix sp.]